MYPCALLTGVLLGMGSRGKEGSGRELKQSTKEEPVISPETYPFHVPTAKQRTG
jgi:hypothetical protein